MPRQKREPQPSTETFPIRIGALIQYYEDGCRYGYLEKVKGKTVKVRPITSRYSVARPRLVTVLAADIIEVPTIPRKE